MTPPGFEPRDPEFAARVRASFARQKVMETIGARLRSVSAGEVQIELPFRDDLTQQNGFLHAGVVATIADSACGYAAFSLMPADASVLTVEYKLNILRPGQGEAMIARGRVVKPGRTLTVVQADVFARRGSAEEQVVSSLQTLMCLAGKADEASGAPAKAR
jgi:uncharacterized protein (TIGR00369 family)